MQAVVERMAALGHFFELVSRPGGSFMARFRTQNTPEAGNLYRNADTAPEAVCRAALAALAALSGAATEPHADPS
jgi:hypothetical protein